MGKSYSLKQLEELSGGNKDFISEIVNVFISDIPLQLNELEKALREKNFADLSKIAHKLKPSIDLFDVSALKEAIRTIENNAKNNINSIGLPKLVEKVVVELNRTLDEIKNR